MALAQPSPSDLAALREILERTYPSDPSRVWLRGRFFDFSDSLDLARSDGYQGA